MLDIICEIFDILCIRFESIGFYYDEYNQFKQMVAAIKTGKCPVIGVQTSYFYQGGNGSHAMVATGIKNKRVQFIQMKNSHADNPNEPGKVR